jgi:hypothetical protein
MRGRGVVLLALTMAACSAPPAPVVDRLGREPNARKLVSEQKLFNQAEARITAMSKPRPWKYSTFYAWRVCAKATVPGPNGAPLPRTYALFIHADDIADRREAIADDLCATEAFEPFTPEPVVAGAEAAPPPPARSETGVFGGMFDWFKSGR